MVLSRGLACVLVLAVGCGAFLHGPIGRTGALLGPRSLSNTSPLRNPVRSVIAQTRFLLRMGGAEDMEKMTVAALREKLEGMGYKVCVVCVCCV